jgi:hypothetical protein
MNADAARRLGSRILQVLFSLPLASVCLLVMADRYLSATARFSMVVCAVVMFLSGAMVGRIEGQLALIATLDRLAAQAKEAVDALKPVPDEDV